MTDDIKITFTRNSEAINKLFGRFGERDKIMPRRERIIPEIKMILISVVPVRNCFIGFSPVY
jgi:hypothetical protein